MCVCVFFYGFFVFISPSHAGFRYRIGFFGVAFNAVVYEYIIVIPSLKITKVDRIPRRKCQDTDE